MKAFLLNILMVIVLLTAIIGSPSLAQEYDDVYFRKSDRKKLEELKTKSDYNLNENKELETLIADNDVPYSEEEYYGYDDPNNAAQPSVSEKHYYYGSAYNNNFDPSFWHDPYLYQGRFFDPYYNSFYRDRYYRPGWSMSFSFGYSNWGWNRWRYRNSYYWNSPYYSNYGYDWNNYYSPWYNDSYWCPPSYNNSTIVVNYGSSNNSRGVVRGRRTTRGRTSGIMDYQDPRGGRTSGINIDGKGRTSGINIDGKGRNGRIDGGVIEKEGKNGRKEKTTSYPDFRRPGRKSDNNINSRSSSPNRTDRRDYNPSNNRNSNNRYNSNRSKSSSSNSYRPSKSNSSSSGNYNSGSRSSGNKSSSGSGRTGRKRD